MLQRALEALGFSVLVFLSTIFEVVSPTPLSIFHTSMAAGSMGTASFIDIFGVAAIFFVVREVLRKKAAWPRWRLALFGVIPAVWLMGSRVAVGTLWQKVLEHIHSWRAHHFVAPDFGVGVPLWGVALFGLVLWLGAWALSRNFPRVYGAAVTAGRLTLLSGGILALLSLVSLASAMKRRLPDEQLAAMHVHNGDTAERPRLVWIIMDELAYRQAFENRPEGLAMPNMDSLARESTNYSHVVPMQPWTDLAIPSIIMGQRYDDMRFNRSKNTVAYLEADDNKWDRLDASKSIFGEAQQRGWNVGLAGWFNPYCTIFSGYLQQCHWMFQDAFSPLRPQYSTWQNVKAPFTEMVSRMNDPGILKMREQEDKQLLAWGMDLAGNDSLDFVVIHVPSPHYPFVYDRKTGKWTTEVGHSYADGLALADMMVGQLMGELKQSPRWNATTVVLNGDHSWRVWLWQTSAGWTAEDQKFSDGGKFDERPVLLIHAPGQAEGVTVTQPVSLLNVHDVIESVLKTGEPSNLP